MKPLALAFIALVLGLAGVPPVAAQQPAKLHRIGFLGNSTAVLERNLAGPFAEGLRALGYVEGSNLHIE
ncbi:MAG TPA: hypothetical protein VIV54_22700, partial [Burkholderiales bacterium]